MDIDRIRQEIDELDHQLVGLLNRRLRLAAEIGKLKRNAGGRIYVAEREETVLNTVTSVNEGPMSNKALRAIYREIMSAAISLEKGLVVAYLGPEATYTHQAALRKFGASVDYSPVATIGDIFTAVEKEEADYGVIPIENSTEGSVRDALDLFVDSELKIVAQVHLEIVHCLISNTPLEKIERVLSKDQALAQCRRWLQRHLPHAQLVDAASTSKAVEVARDTPGTAAVASPLAAEYYGVPVLTPNIQDKADNTTRFFIIGKEPTGPVEGGRNMSSFLISLSDEPGALAQMLNPLSSRGINLSKIESRPSRRRPWDYYFFIDITGHFDDPPVKDAVRELKQICPMVKWLGSFPAAG